MKNSSFSSAFCVKTYSHLPVKLSLSSCLPLALRSKLLNSFQENTTCSVLVSLALFSLSCIPAHAQTSNQYEAENAIVGGGAGTYNVPNASSGKIVGNIVNAGANVQFSGIDGGTRAGKSNLVIRFANGFGDNRNLTLYVNGTKVQQLVFGPTGGWSTFKDLAAISVSLNSGTGNTIKIQRDNADVANADIDKITLSPTSTSTPTPTPTSLASPIGTGNGLKASYRNGTDAANSPIILTRTDAKIDFNWGLGAPDPSIPTDRFSVKWEGEIQPRYTGEYTFYGTSDDGNTIIINGQTVVYDPNLHAAQTTSGKITLEAGKKYPITVMFSEATGDASMKLEWSSANQSREVVPTSQLYSTAVAQAPAPTPTPTPTPALTSPFSAGLSVFNPNPFGYTVQQMLDKNVTGDNGVVYYTTFQSTPADVVAPRTDLIKWYAANGFDPTVYHWQQRSNPFPTGGTAQAADVVLGTVSTDSTFARPIPDNAPSFRLPVSYLGGGEVQRIDPNGGYGYGIGRVMARGTDPVRTITDSLGKVYQIKVPADLRQDGGVGIPPNLPGADKTVIWYDQSTKTYRTSWGTELAADRVNYKCAFITDNLQLPLLGHEGAIAASRIPEMAGLILPGELTANRPMGHALKGPTHPNKLFSMGIVYPASDQDHPAPGNQGLLPYGARVRLPKSVDLKKMALSLPARRVLEAIQDYGWFVDDSGVRDMDIKTSTFYGETSGYPGFEKEVFDVIKANAMEIVLPSVKLK